LFCRGENRFVRNCGVDETKRNYKWPWFFWGAVILFIALAVLWVAFAAKKISDERDVNAPLPSTAPVR
jgi:bacteriorhodopsin